MTTDRTVTLDTGQRKVDVPVDALGRMRFRAQLDERRVIRAEGDGDSNTVGFKGHAAVFGKRTWIGSKRWGFWEQIEKGAFTKTIGEADVRLLFNHNPDLVLGRNKSGTLRLSEDDVGLAVDADLDTRQSYAADLVVALERGDVDQMSFAFEPIAWRWEEAEDGKELYTLTECRLWDTAPVTYPAYLDTDAGLRGAAFEALTRSLGIDEDEVLRRLDAEATDLDDYLRRQVAGTPGPAETTRGDTSPPAETTGDTATRTPAEPGDFDAMREHRFAELTRSLGGTPS